MKRPAKLMRQYNCWASKDGKQYHTTCGATSNAAAKRIALKVYPVEQGYTDHAGQRRIA